MANRNMHMRRYLREIRNGLPCSRELKRKIIDEISSSVSRYLTKNPGGNYDEIVAKFGTPEQIASSYVNEMDSSELVHKLLIRKKIVRMVFAVAIVVVILWVGVVSISLLNEIKNADGYYDVSIVDNETNHNDQGGN